ncbi:MAG: hypothetical protein LKG26_00130 [Saccharofermentans sp.]|jgi:flavodoxin|nr:hypothetical protein [Mageeibacillus sp.]MCI1263571.1 hypothetical protein [Saccharofermentans sp.]MCI1274490.1 hypothetical protein [Saccharofermentans sp.]
MRIIVYYSLSENTKEAAERIAAITGAELLRVDFLKPMSKSKAAQFVHGGREATFGVAPKLKEYSDLSSYDEIILGFPIWAGKNASPINTVLKDMSVRGKVTSVFTLSGGGDNDKCIAVLRKKLPALRNVVALADRAHETAGDNDAKIEAFGEAIMNG